MQRVSVWPVIHLSTPEVAQRNAAIAERCGFDGVFLIQMDGLDDAIDPVALELKRMHPALKVGINYLTLPAHIALVRCLGLGMDATWADSPGISSTAVSPMVGDAIVPVLQRNTAHLFFASVAFKYQTVEPNPPGAAIAAASFGLIPTTSGPATGQAPHPAKLHAMRAALEQGPLAVASGITPDNAHELGRHVSHVLVSTGISRSFYEFDEELLRSLMEQLAP